MIHGIVAYFWFVLRVTRYALFFMCYALRDAVARDACCVVVRFHALLRPLNCDP